MTNTDSALFPISLSNQEFNTVIVQPLLPDIFSKHEFVIFLVADHLQIYNKALNVPESLNFPDLLKGFGVQIDYLDQRKRWVERMMATVLPDIARERWRVIGLKELLDAACFRIFRNVMLASYSVPTFSIDLDEAAALHADRRSLDYPLDRRRLLSRGYLLEEIALSIRIHIIEGVSSEYYIGEQSRPVLGVHDGRYGFFPSDLSETEPPRWSTTFYSMDLQGINPGWKRII